MELVILLPSRKSQMLDAELGIGQKENVLPAQITLSSTTLESVSLFLINAILLMAQELVLLVMKDTT